MTAPPLWHAEKYLYDRDMADYGQTKRELASLRDCVRAVRQEAEFAIAVPNVLGGAAGALSRILAACRALVPS